MKIIATFKDSLYIDKIFTRKNAFVFTGIVAEISMIALMILSQIPIILIGLTLAGTNLLKLVFFAKKMKKKDEDISRLLKKMRETNNETLALKTELEQIKAKLIN